MCGIIGLFNIQNKQAMRQEALKMVRKIRHRGPDWSGSYSDENCVLMHERLSIVDVEHGAQPLYDTKTDRVLAVNGEIYNHKKVAKKRKFSDALGISTDLANHSGLPLSLLSASTNLSKCSSITSAKCMI